MTRLRQRSQAASKLPLDMRAVRSQIKLYVYVRLEFLTTLYRKIRVFWDVMSCILIDT